MFCTNMFKLMFKIMIRKFLVYFKVFGRRKAVLLVPSLMMMVLVLWPMGWWIAMETSRALILPLPPDKELDHLWRNRNLEDYLSKIQVLIEPSQPPCASLDDYPVIVLVTSGPLRFEQRMAVRQTWAKYQPTFFVLGLQGDNADDLLVDNYIEAKQYGDIIVFEYRDHYQNLTLKTALMMKWSLEHCSQAQFLMKTDDDVLVNPWVLKKVIKENENAKLLGYRHNNSLLNREEYNKWYSPRWLYREDRISSYLSGTSYLINGDYLQTILEKAYKVPLVNIEDVYYTYIVAQKELGLSLTHDRRISPYKPWLKVSCLYAELATVHSLQPEEMLAAWSKLKSVANVNSTFCDIFNYFFEGYSDQVFMQNSY